MSWPFVGRTEEISRIAAALRASVSRPIVITGESGIGRTAVVSRALQKSGASNRTILRFTPSGRVPLATLGAFAHPSRGASLDTQVVAATGELARLADHTRLVAVVDDAHRADHASLLALRELTRQGHARLIITLPAGRVGVPDPVDCLRYERGATTVRLGPLDHTDVVTLLDEVIGDHVHPATVAALHAASGGSPTVLRHLVVAGDLLDCLAERTGGWRMRTPTGHLPEPVTGADADLLVGATERAWRSLALDQVEELCRLAAWRGAVDRVRPIWATTLLLRGKPQRSLRLLDAVRDIDPHLALVRAIALALGLHRPAAAAAYLSGIGDEVPSLRARVAAYRAWLLATAGHRVPLPTVGGDRETVVFRRAASATLALAEGHPAAAVGQLRRALAGAEGCRAELPWLPPFLTACLIDALLLAGRIKEATATASEFHAGKADNGWDVAVVIAALASQTMTALTLRETTEGMKTA
jgi:hypothetical protein